MPDEPVSEQPEIDLRARPVAVTLLTVSGVGAIVPFVASYASSSFDGTKFSYHDYVAIGGGVLAIVFALNALMFVRRAKAAPLFAAAAVLVALGGYDLAKGFGVFVEKPTLSPAVLEDAPVPMAAKPAAPKTCGDAATCVELADRIKKDDPPGAAAASERACGFGDGYSCDHAGDAWATGRAGAKDPVKAHALYAKGCGLKDRESCLDLGIDFMVGNGVAKDPAMGIPYLELACDLSALVACKDLATAYRDGDGVAADKVKSFAFAKRACGEGNYDTGEVAQVGYGCLMAGEDLAGGIGTKKDPVAAIPMFEKACSYHPQHCTDLAIANDLGQSIPVDKKRAIELYTKACDADGPVACSNLAISYEQGDGVAADKPHAVALYKKACDLDSATSCNNLALMTERGQGGLAKDPAAAKSLFEKACGLGSPNSCKHENKPPPPPKQ